MTVPAPESSLDGACASAASDAERRAELQRVAEERYATSYEEQRTWSFLLAVTLLAAGLTALTFAPGVKGFLRVTPVELGALMALEIAVIAAATLCARRFGGVLGRAHRVAERLETATGAVVCSALIYLSGQAVSVFGLLSLLHLMHSSWDILNARFIRVMHGLCLFAVALAFVAGGRLADAVTLAFFGAVVLFLARVQERAARSFLGAQAEQNLLRRRVEALLVEQERQRIARDLHDGLGAELTALAWMAEAPLVDATSPEARLRELSLLARTGLTDLRLVVDGLEASSQRVSELAASIERSCRALVAPPCVLTVERRGDAIVRSEAGLQLGLMIREAVRNAAQHAAPRRIVVSFRVEGDELALSVQDDGRGLPSGALEGSRGGLSHLRKRAKALDAELRVDGASAGTTVSVRLKALAPARAPRPADEAPCEAVPFEQGARGLSTAVK